MSGRPHLPTWLRRELLLEAGHQCAIPTCRRRPVELTHIIGRAKSNDDQFDNLIALCPNCHAAFDRLGLIKAIEMRAYKRNLEKLGEWSGNLARRLQDLEIWQLMELYGFPWPAARRITRDAMGRSSLPGGCGKSYVFGVLSYIQHRHGLTPHRVVVGGSGADGSTDEAHGVS